MTEYELLGNKVLQNFMYAKAGETLPNEENPLIEYHNSWSKLYDAYKYINDIIQSNLDLKDERVLSSLNLLTQYYDKMIADDKPSAFSILVQSAYKAICSYGGNDFTVSMSNKEKFLCIVSHENDSTTMDFIKYRIKNREWLRISQQIALKILLKKDELKYTFETLSTELNIDVNLLEDIVRGSENLTLDIIIKLEKFLNINIINKEFKK